MDDVEPETKAVVENLTGHSYDKCWGHNDFVVDMEAQAATEK